LVDPVIEQMEELNYGMVVELLREVAKNWRQPSRLKAQEKHVYTNPVSMARVIDRAIYGRNASKETYADFMKPSEATGMRLARQHRSWEEYDLQYKKIELLLELKLNVTFDTLRELVKHYGWHTGLPLGKLIQEAMLQAWVGLLQFLARYYFAEMKLFFAEHGKEMMGSVSKEFNGELYEILVKMFPTGVPAVEENGTKLMRMMVHKEYRKVGEEGRRVYDSTGSTDVLWKIVFRYMDSLLQKKEGIKAVSDYTVFEMLMQEVPEMYREIDDKAKLPEWENVKKVFCRSNVGTFRRDREMFDLTEQIRNNLEWFVRQSSKLKGMTAKEKDDFLSKQEKWDNGENLEEFGCVGVR
jgi:hypothetical protein